jgi:uncharacterized protein YgiM (DUF1202 family)
MKKFMKTAIPVLFILSLLAACTAPSEEQSISNAVMETMVGFNVQSSQTALAQQAIDQATGTAAIYPTLTTTPTVYSSPTPSDVWLTVNENTNCRKGPGANYDINGMLEKDQRVQSLARNFDNNYYYIVLPGSDNVKCWVWAKYLTVEGDATPLPIYTALPSPTPSPTPTPIPSFNASVMDLENCGGAWIATIKIYNNGGVTWESVHLKIKDTVTGDISYFASDSFVGYNSCAIVSEKDNIAPGGEGTVTNIKGKLKSNPSGHRIEITITLYTKDGLNGSSYTQTISFKP